MPAYHNLFLVIAMNSHALTNAFDHHKAGKR